MPCLPALTLIYLIIVLYPKQSHFRLHSALEFVDAHFCVPRFLQAFLCPTVIASKIDSPFSVRWLSNSWACVGVLLAQPKRRPLNFLEHKNTIYCRTNKNQWKLKNVQSFAAKEEAHRKQAWKQWDKLSHTQSANKPNWPMLPSFGFKERISIVFCLLLSKKTI